jgi:hypothetical protein
MHKTAVHFNGPVFGRDVAIQSVGSNFVLTAIVGCLDIHIVLFGIPIQVAESKFALVVCLNREILTTSPFLFSHRIITPVGYNRNVVSLQVVFPECGNTSGRDGDRVV